MTTILSLALAAGLGAQVETLDLKPGTLLCSDERSAAEFMDAVASDPGKLTWLLNGACTRLPIAYRDQVVLRSMGELPKVLWTNGKWEQERVVIPPAIAARANRLLAQPTDLFDKPFEAPSQDAEDVG